MLIFLLRGRAGGPLQSTDATHQLPAPTSPCNTQRHCCPHHILASHYPLPPTCSSSLHRLWSRCSHPLLGKRSLATCASHIFPGQTCSYLTHTAVKSMPPPSSPQHMSPITYIHGCWSAQTQGSQRRPWRWCASRPCFCPVFLAKFIEM